MGKVMDDKWLIAEVEKYRIVYDQSDTLCKDITVKQWAWDVIESIIGAAGKALQ